jgi:hypothetical protein
MPKLPTGKMMAFNDAKFVVSRVTFPMQSEDPYSSDFYYIQNGLKKSSKELMAAQAEGKQAPLPFVPPLPVWKDTKDRIRGQMEDSRRSLQAKTKDWESKEGVLGMTETAWL